ncbi:MAG: hypothetical protein WC799_22360 [Desulfobacteraceae bacterium]|jgi:hypothetical protein
MKKIYIIAVVALLFTSIAYGQEPPETQKPATKLEAFQDRTGIVVVRGYTTVGAIRGRGMGSVITVDARDFRDASNLKARQTGISITVKESGRIERENTAYIDSDEITSLLAGIDYVSKATKDITPLTNFEVEYRTKGNFNITVFNKSGGELSAEVSAGYIGNASAFISLPQIIELRQLILDAKSKI